MNDDTIVEVEMYFEDTAYRDLIRVALVVMQQHIDNAPENIKQKLYEDKQAMDMYNHMCNMLLNHDFEVAFEVDRDDEGVRH